MRELVGREEQLRAVEDVLLGAEARRGGLLLLTGPPGIGKTRLAEEVAVRAVARRFDAVWGAARDGEQGLPYRPWRAVIRSVARLAGVGDDRSRALLAATGDGTAAARAVWQDEVAELLREAAQRRPLVVVVEDAHWCDEDSLLLLEVLTGALRLERVLFVVTTRDPGPLLERLRPDGHVAVPPLTVQETARLLELLAPREDLDAAELHARSAGSPMLVRELVGLVQQGRGDALPPSVLATVQVRLDRLGPAPREVLAAAAVVGEETPLDLLDAVVGDADSLAEGLDAALAAGLLVPVARAVLRYRFPHALVRDAVLAASPPAVRRGLHRRAADALLARDAAAGDVAAHAVAAVDDAASASVALPLVRRAAAEAAAGLAVDQAVQLLRLAVQLADAGGQDVTTRARVRLELAAGLLRVGRVDPGREEVFAAARLLRGAPQPCPDRDDLLAHAALALSGGLEGFEVPLYDDAQVALLREALAGEPDPALRAHLLARLSVALTFLESDVERAALADEAVAEARRAGDTGALVLALSARCDAHAGPAHVALRTRTAVEMVQMARHTGSVGHLLLALRFQLVAQLESGDVVGATRTVALFDHHSRRLGHPGHRFYVPLWTATLAALGGDVRSARERNAEAEMLGEQAGSANAAALTMSQRLSLQIETGSADQAVEVLRGFTAAHPELPGPRVGLAWALAVSGRSHEAHGLVHRMASDGFSEHPVDAEWLASLSLSATVAGLVRCRAAAAVLLDLLTPHAELFAVDGIGDAVLGSVAGCLAPLAALLGRQREADHLWERALALEAEAGAVLPLARTRAAYGACLAARGDPRGAHLVRQAREVCASAGLPPPVTVGESSGGDVHAVRLEHEGDTWVLDRGGRVVRLRAGKGLRVLARLVARPGEEVHVLDLDDRRDRRGGAVQSGLGPVLDATAKAAYRRRLGELEEALDEARADGDAGQVGRLGDERELLLAELRRCLGLGGRDRPVGDDVERARVNVTKALRTTVRRIAEGDPDLGRHLDSALVTGTWCCYRPDPSSRLRWTVRARGRPDITH